MKGVPNLAAAAQEIDLLWQDDYKAYWTVEITGLVLLVNHMISITSKLRVMAKVTMMVVVTKSEEGQVVKEVLQRVTLQS